VILPLPEFYAGMLKTKNNKKRSTQIPLHPSDFVGLEDGVCRLFPEMWSQ
jgi:hypothetical protein